jgi:RNA polymerase sigma factor (sigma-70 family)
VVEDAVADTCSTVVVCFDAARAADTFSGFVYGHYMNVRRRLIRSQRNEGTLEGVDISEPFSTEIETGPGERELGALKLCLGELHEREQRAVGMRYWEEAPPDQIAGALGVTAANARQIVFRALAKLRRCIQRELSELRNAMSSAAPTTSEVQ